MLSKTRDDTVISESYEEHHEIHHSPPHRRTLTTKDLGFKRSQENTSRLSLIIDDIIEF